MTHRGKKDEVWNRTEIQSPCVRICVLHQDEGICIGCYRTRDEIGKWSLMTDEERAKLMEELPDRGGRLRKRRGGRRRTSSQ